MSLDFPLRTKPCQSTDLASGRTNKSVQHGRGAFGNSTAQKRTPRSVSPEMKMHVAGETVQLGDDQGCPLPFAQLQAAVSPRASGSFAAKPFHFAG
jgi:hypothetical protein